MKKSRVLILVACFVVAGLIFNFWIKPFSSFSSDAKLESTRIHQSPILSVTSPQDQTKQTRSLSNLPDPNAMKAFATAFKMPFSCWGKVVDEEGSPIADAEVIWSANNNPNPYGSGTKGQTTSGADGMFSIASHGIGLHVEVSKSGFYQVPRQSRANLSSFGGFDNTAAVPLTNSPMRPRENPAIFVLHKIGETVPLIHWGKSININRNGSPVKISLQSGQLVQEGEGDLKVESWINNQTKNAQRRYDWHCRVSVFSGGLIERKDQFHFEAPAYGYKPFDEINMPQTAKMWNPQASREYFIKLADGRYARIKFVIIASDDSFFTITSYLNPTPGNRNLEFDPNKVVTSP